MAWETAATIINDVLAELALADSDVEAPFASEDATVIQLRRLLKPAGRYLLRQHGWSHLQKTHTLDTVAGTALYDLPADFARLIDQTQWNRTEQLPLGGPVSPQGWQLLKSLSTAGVVNYYHRIAGNKLEVHPTPNEANTLAFEYYSLWWVQPAVATAPTAEVPSLDADILWFDGHLLSRLLRLRWLEAKGFDTAAALSDYQQAFDAATSADGAAPVLRLDRQSMSLWRPLDGHNVPFTGIGQE